MTPAGFPHSDISGSTSARDSPKLFAACHVLHRLLAPRHPPRALCSLTTTATHQAVSCHVARDAPCTQLGEIEDLQSAETYPVVKVGPCGLGRPGGRLPSDPLVGELLWLTDQRSDEGPDIKRRCVSTLWLGRLAPVFISMAGALEAVAGPPAGFGLWRRGDSNS